jgi:Tfp pilus assembly protein PilO
MNDTSKATPFRFVHVALVVLALVTAGLAYWAARLWRDLMAAETEIAQLRVRSAQAVSAETLQARNDALRARVAELEAQRAAIPAPVAPPPADPAKAKSFGAIASAMLNTPVMREMMVRTQKAGLERRFADLMNQLGLSPEDRTRFIDLLSDKQMLTIDTGLKMMSGNLSADERAAVVQQIKDANAASADYDRGDVGAGALKSEKCRGGTRNTERIVVR